MSTSATCTSPANRCGNNARLEVQNTHSLCKRRKGAAVYYWVASCLGRRFSWRSLALAQMMLVWSGGQLFVDHWDRPHCRGARSGCGQVSLWAFAPFPDTNSYVLNVGKGPLRPMTFYSLRAHNTPAQTTGKRKEKGKLQKHRTIQNDLEPSKTLSLLSSSGIAFPHSETSIRYVTEYG